MKPLRIGLLWHSLRAGNLGVGALTLGNMTIIREVAEELGRDVEFVVLSMRESYTQSIAPGVKQFEIDTRAMVSPGGFWSEIGSLDAVVDIGAGDSFADIYGAKRFGFMWLSKQLTTARRIPLILAPQTIGPFENPVLRRLAKSVMEQAEAVVARDRKSLAAIEETAPKANSHLAVDVAFKLPFEDRSSLRGSNGKFRLGINASGLLCRQAETKENRFGLSFDYLRLHRRLIDHFTSSNDVEVHLVTHANSAKDKSDDDGARADALHAEFPRTIRVPDFADPSEAKSYISGLDFLIAGRMHACIAAFSSCTPVVPIAYSRKFSGLFGLLEYPWLTPVSGMTEDEAFDFIIASIGETDAMQAAESAALDKVETMLDGYRTVLRAQFAKNT